MTDDRLEARLRAWYRSAAGEAKLPVALAAHVEGIPTSVAAPRFTAPSWLGRRPAIALATVAVMFIAAAVGLRFDPLAAFVGGDASPSATAPVAVGSPSPESISGSQVAGPMTYELPWPGGPAGARVEVAIPAGQAVWASGSAIAVTEDGRGPRWEDPGSAPDLGIHDVTGVVDEVCAYSDPTDHLVSVGPTADDLVAALSAQRGWTDRSGPVDDTVAGYPAWKFTFDLDVRPGPGCSDPAEGVMLWQGRDGTSFVLLEGHHQGTATVWVVDVDGHRLVLTATDYLELSTRQQRATRDAILASLEIGLGAAPTPFRTPDGAIALPFDGEIAPGRYQSRWGNLVPHLTIPAGWSSTDGGRTISKYDPDTYRPHVRLTVHDVGPFVAIDACASKRTLVETTTIEELTNALEDQAGVERSGPTDVMIGGYPGRKFVLTLPRGCPGPELGQGVVFLGWGETDFGLGYGATGTIYVVDPGTGDPMVITTSVMDASPEDLRELDAIVESIDIR